MNTDTILDAALALAVSYTACAHRHPTLKYLGVMRKLERDGLMTMTELAAYAEFSTARATEMVDTMEISGWVKRVLLDGDRRKIHVQITKKGAAELEKARKKLAQELADLSR